MVAVQVLVKMTHNICTGGCKGVSEEAKNCGAEECSKHGQPLTQFDCPDYKNNGAFGESRPCYNVYFLIEFRYFFIGVGIFVIIVPIYYCKIMDMEVIFAVCGFYLLGATFKKYLKWAKLGGYKHPYLRF